MNKPYFRRQPRYRNGLVQGRGAFAMAIVALLVAALAAVRYAAPSAFSQLASPLWAAGSYVGGNVGGIAAPESKAALREDRDRLAAENAAVTAQNASLSAQVRDLTALLGGRTDPPDGVVAQVLSGPPVAPYDVLVIDQGTDAGVALGALVTGPGGTPVGTVGVADRRQARVALYSTRGLKTGGWVGGSRIPVTLTGAGAGAFGAQVPKEAGVQVGDGVYVSGADLVPIGTVVRIEADPSSPSVGLDVRPYVNPFSLPWVAVARP